MTGFAPGSFTTDYPAWARRKENLIPAETLASLINAATATAISEARKAGKTVPELVPVLGAAIDTGDSIAARAFVVDMSEGEFERLLADIKTVVEDRARAGREALKTLDAAAALAAAEAEAGSTAHEAEPESAPKVEIPPVTAAENAEIAECGGNIAGAILSISRDYYEHIMRHRRVRATEWTASIALALGAAFVITEDEGGFEGVDYKERVDMLLNIVRNQALDRDIEGARKLMENAPVEQVQIDGEPEAERVPDKKRMH